MTLARDESRKHSIRIKTRFTFPSDITAFTVQLPQSIDVVSTDGLQIDGPMLTWDERTTVPTAVGQYDPGLMSEGGFKAVDWGDWAVVTRPRGGISANWTFRGDEISYDYSYDIDGSGVISSDGAIAYLGPYQQYERNSISERLNLIIPDAAQLQHSPEEILDCIESASRSLEIGPISDEVLMIAAPSCESNWGPTGTQFGDEGFWALDRTQLDHPNNTWIHEYVHTRQSFQHQDSLLWLIEGTANYFAAHVGFNQGRIDFDKFHSHLNRTIDSKAILSDPSTWSSSRTKYTKGAVVTSALDTEIRERSKGRFNLMDILRELGKMASNRDLSMRDFRSVLADKNLSLSEWLDNHVSGAQMPPLSEEPEAYGFDTSSVCDDATDPTVPVKQDDESEVEKEPEGGSETDQEPGDETPDVTRVEEAGETGDEIDDPTEPETVKEPGKLADECPVCGTPADDSDVFCSACGTALQRECYVCGGQAPGQEYCPICGTELLTACSVCGLKQNADGTYCEDCGTEF